jgi:hypothetical protein
MEKKSYILRAEAHLYVAVAKADGMVTKKEYAATPYYAMKSQNFFDMMEMNQAIAEKIGGEIRDILNNPAYAEWDSVDHLDEAIRHNQHARDTGVWQSRVIFEKNEKGFLNTAKIDGYNIKESRFIKIMEEKLRRSLES